MKSGKFNLLKEYKSDYSAKTSPEIIEVEKGKFLTIIGQGAPGTEEFQEKISALYSLAYGIKKDFTVGKLEGIWWVESNRPYNKVPRDKWKWKLLIRQPEFITSENVKKAKQEITKKKKNGLISEIKLETMKEGKCVQILHIGPYSTEFKSLEKIRKLMNEKQLVENGPHHEIYLSDPRKVSEEKLKTILRQPVKPRE